MLTVYGIPNCDTVKKARTWLDAHALAYQFHDYKKQGVPLDVLKAAARNLGWEKLLNRQGQTWRKLSDAEKSAVTDAAKAYALMEKQPSVIRRPLVKTGNGWLIGFDENTWRDAFRKSA